MSGYVDKRFAFRNYYGQEPTTENLRREMEDLYEFVNGKFVELDAEKISLINQLSSSVNSSLEELTAEVQQLATTQTTQDESFAQLQTIVAANASNSEARYQEIITAYASADSALALSITTLSATVGSNTVAISTEQSARIAADGQIHARWGVAIDVNGRITGRINLDGTNETSTIDFQADKIRFWDGAATFTPFQITANDGQASLTSARSIFGDSSNSYLDFVQFSTGVTQLRVRRDTNTVGYLQTVNVPSFGYQGELSLSRTWDGNTTLMSANSLDTGIVRVRDYLAKTSGTSDGWTPKLYDDDNEISFKWDGSDLKVKIDATEYTVTIT